MDLNGIFMVGYVFLLSFAAVSDYRKLIIPNWISLTMIGLFFAFAFFVRPDLPVLEHVGVGIAVLVVGLVLFGLRLLSAGDVKLVAAVAVWAGPLHILPVIFVVTVLGALLAVVILQVKRFHRLAGANGVPPFISQLIPNWARHGLCPYALAISAGGLFLLPVMFV